MPGFDAGAPLRLSEQVALREESFGALAYHYGNRRLVFLKSPGLVELVRALGGFPSGRDAVDALVADGDREAYLGALERLFHQGVLRAA